MNDPAMRIRISAGIAAIVFVVGYFLLGSIPGGGGETTVQDFTDFYGDDGKRQIAFIAAVIFVAGAASVIWCFTQLRAVAAGTLASFAHAVAIAGASLAAAGGTLLLAPSAVQTFGGGEFVGMPIAHVFAEAGYGVMLIPGMGLLGIASAAISLGLARTGAVPSWLGWVGVVLGVVVAIGSIIWLPGLLFPVWLLLVAIVGVRSERITPAMPA